MKFGGLCLFGILLLGSLSSSHANGSCSRASQPVPPSITLRRRVLANFTPGSTNPYIKILFVSDTDVNVTWFRDAQGAPLPNSDVPGMLQAAAYNGYFVSSLRSWNVRATTLRVNASDYDNAKEATYVTTFEFADAAISYKLRTTIKPGNTDAMIIQNLSGFRWIARPNVTVTYEHEDSVHLLCTAQSDVNPSASARKGDQSDELILYSYDIKADSSSRLGDMPGQPSLVKVHPEDGNKSSDDGNIGYKTTFTKCSPSLQEFSIDYNIKRATDTSLRLFVCRMVKGEGSMYASATLRRNKPDTTRARVKLIPCENISIVRNGELLMTEGNETCLRCQAYGEGVTGVALDKDDGRFPTNGVVVRKYVNVNTGGLHESVYTFLHPDKSIVGGYKCVAKQPLPGGITKEASFPFEITLAEGRSTRRRRTKRTG